MLVLSDVKRLIIIVMFSFQPYKATNTNLIDNNNKKEGFSLT